MRKSVAGGPAGVLRGPSGLAMLALTILFTGLGYLWITHLTVTYRSDDTVILLVPQDSSKNPYTYFPKSVIRTAQAVAMRVDQDSTRARLAAEGATAPFTIEVTNNGNQWVAIYNRPSINVSSTSTDRDETNRTVRLVIEETASQLAMMQRETGAPASQWITPQLLDQAPDAYPQSVPKSRALLITVVISGWSSFLLVRLVQYCRRFGWRVWRWRPAPPDQRGGRDTATALVPVHRVR